MTRTGTTFAAGATRLYRLRYPSALPHARYVRAVPFNLRAVVTTSEPTPVLRITYPVRQAIGAVGQARTAAMARMPGTRARRHVAEMLAFNGLCMSAQKRRRRRSRCSVRVVTRKRGRGGETPAGCGKRQALKRRIKQGIKQSDAAARRSGPSHRVKPEKARERLREQLAAIGQSVTQQPLRKGGQRAAGINDGGIAYCGRRRHRWRARLCDGN